MFENLPCSWRGTIDPTSGRARCSSPKLYAPLGVTTQHCGSCYCRNHEVPPGHRDTRHLVCKHLGAANGELVRCPTCTGEVKLKLFHCAVHGQCTQAKIVDGVASCIQCADRADIVPFAIKGTIRNLIYHVAPFPRNGVWQRNIGQLLRRIRAFNGRRVVAIVTGSNLDPAQDVRDLLSGHVHEFIEMPNNPRLGEVVTFKSLLSRVKTEDPAQITFYGHAKGVSRPVNEGVTVHRWTDIMYETCLDYIPLVEQALARYPVAGSFKKRCLGFAGSSSAWHYSGTFFWFRNAEIFKRNWEVIDQQWGGVEAWPGVHFAPDEGESLFGGRPDEFMNLYDMNCLKTYQRDLEVWRAAHEKMRKVW